MPRLKKGFDESMDNVSVRSYQGKIKSYSAYTPQF